MIRLQVSTYLNMTMRNMLQASRACMLNLPMFRHLSGRTGQLRQVDIHAVALFFFVQLYSRQAQRPDAMDVWPSQAAQDEKAFNSQLMPAHQQGQTLPHQPHHSPLQNGTLPGLQEPVSPARSNSSRSSAGSQSSPGQYVRIMHEEDKFLDKSPFNGVSELA